MSTKRPWFERNIGTNNARKAKEVLGSGPMTIHAVAAFLGVSTNAARAALKQANAVEWRRIHNGKRGRPVVLWALP